jgi:predicted amidophosphoribosyltransferase
MGKRLGDQMEMFGFTVRIPSKQRERVCDRCGADLHGRKMITQPSGEQLCERCAAPAPRHHNVIVS